MVALTEKDEMKTGELYAIGEVSRLCNVSRKALRFYDKIGLISPDYVSEQTGYRYYKADSLLYIPVIKYFKQCGFRLEEMKEFLDASDYSKHEEGFRNKIEELKILRENTNVSYVSVCDWYNLILEARSVIQNRADQVALKFIDTIVAPYYVFEFDGNYMSSVINIEFTNYLEEIGDKITGAVMIEYEDMQAKLEGRSTRARIFQRNMAKTDRDMFVFGGEMMLTAYHIGSHDSINDTYDKMFSWADKHGYSVGDRSFERYVTDYWTVKNQDNFVTEVMLPLVK